MDLEPILFLILLFSPALLGVSIIVGIAIIDMKDKRKHK